MQVRYMGKRRPITEARYRVYSTLNKRKKSKTNKAERTYKLTLKFLSAVAVGYLFVDIILSLNGF